MEKWRIGSPAKVPCMLDEGRKVGFSVFGHLANFKRV
jgi:hypothetical protein